MPHLRPQRNREPRYKCSETPHHAALLAASGRIEGGVDYRTQICTEIRTRSGELEVFACARYSSEAMPTATPLPFQTLTRTTTECNQQQLIPYAVSPNFDRDGTTLCIAPGYEESLRCLPVTAP
ncbi:hypothetical protein HBH61_060540 [Parastagonospora nodorum]|nr:hypothetical protein HBH61_060540 [Parastagonospora nodorum]KAH5021119.1 hypothetical protein HBI74_151400 [Parastagonospora nodorum]KAH5208287.1 hypothetical protein HBH68_081350 [Parastagonospora nodorum]KAH5794092.1 hypothetical protein HBI97_027440 [Parastagonospora nodorum]KAH5971598.1 hypothetical protein HBI85_056290 [Parastagonospora nodorum]